MTLQLADNKTGPSLLPNEVLEYMVQIPNGQGGFMWVREDQLDHLTDADLYKVLQMQPHLSGISDWFARMRERREQRREGRLERIQARGENIAQLVGGIFGGGGGGVDPYAAMPRDFNLPQFTGGASFGVSKWWQNPMVIGGLIIGGGLAAYAIVKATSK